MGVLIFGGMIKQVGKGAASGIGALNLGFAPRCSPLVHHRRARRKVFLRRLLGARSTAAPRDQGGLTTPRIFP